MSDESPDIATDFFSKELFEEELKRAYRYLAHERLIWKKHVINEILNLQTEKPLYWTSKKVKETIKYIMDNQMPRYLQETPVEFNNFNNYKITPQSKVIYTGGKYISADVPILILVEKEYWYDVLIQCHLSTHHGNFNQMIDYIKDKNYLIPTAAIMAFVKLCEYCRNKGKKTTIIPQNLLLTKPAVYCLIDLQLKPAGICKFVLYYSDLNTKCSILLPLISNSAEEIASGLLTSFMKTGLPTLLHSDERNFITEVHKVLIKLRPGAKNIELVQCHESAMDKMCENIMKLIQNWLVENDCTSWAFGVSFLQHKVNCVFDETMIKNAPQVLTEKHPLPFKGESNNSAEENKTNETISLDERGELKTEDKTNTNENFEMNTLANALGI